MEKINNSKVIDGMDNLLCLFGNKLNIDYFCVNNLDLNPEKNSFRTFYGVEYEKGVAEKAINSSIFSNAVLGTSPIIDYVNRNVPKDADLKVIYNYIILL